MKKTIILSILAVTFSLAGVVSAEGPAGSNSGVDNSALLTSSALSNGPGSNDSGVNNIPVPPAPVVPAPVVSSNSSSGGSSSGYSPIPPAGAVLGASTGPGVCAVGHLFNTATGARCAGQVLGASSFKFDVSLKKGHKSDAVRELQERLRTEGFFTYATSTGYFGSITLSAVKAYQKTHNIPQTGFVGPMTRAELNK